MVAKYLKVRTRSLNFRSQSEPEEGPECQERKNILVAECYIDWRCREAAEKKVNYLKHEPEF